MTHKDIYTKFMIEYDKANVTSSYPSLTEYEVATVLDKAYNALIAQKVTGNNVRRAGFEVDLKVIEDLAPLITQKSDVTYDLEDFVIAPNVMSTELPSDHLYFINAYLKYSVKGSEIQEVMIDSSICNHDSSTEGLSDPGHLYSPNTFKLNTYDKHIASPTDYTLTYNGADTTFRYCQVYYTPSQYGDDWNVGQVVETATLDQIKQALFVSNEGTVPYILIWLDNKSGAGKEFSVFCKERNTVNPYDQKSSRMVPTKLVTHDMATKFYTSSFNMPWIKTPVCYIENNKLYVVYDLLNAPESINGTIIYIKKPNAFVKDHLNEDCTFFDDNNTNDPAYNFECNSTVAEELISLAVSFALENVESQRLNSKLNMRGLEA